jgi:hypothetical protein
MKAFLLFFFLLATAACTATVDGTGPKHTETGSETTTTTSSSSTDPPAVAPRGARCACYSEYASNEVPPTTGCCEDGLECLIDGREGPTSCNRDQNYCERRGYCMERKKESYSCNCGGCPSGYVCRQVDSTCRCEWA